MLKICIRDTQSTWQQITGVVIPAQCQTIVVEVRIAKDDLFQFRLHFREVPRFGAGDPCWSGNYRPPRSFSGIPVPAPVIWVPLMQIKQVWMSFNISSWYPDPRVFQLHTRSLVL